MFIKLFEIWNYFAAAVNSQKNTSDMASAWVSHIYKAIFIKFYEPTTKKKKNRKKDDDGDDVFLTVGH